MFKHISPDVKYFHAASTLQNIQTHRSHYMIIYRMVIVEGHCDKLLLLISYIYYHWLTKKSIVSSDWSDTMLDIAVTFFYHPIYMIID